MDERTTERPAEPGDSVGLGHVVENAAGLADRAANPQLIEPDVDASSELSFPASDPPAFMGKAATRRVRQAAPGGDAPPSNGDTPRDRGRVGLPRPLDVP